MAEVGLKTGGVERTPIQLVSSGSCWHRSRRLFLPRRISFFVDSAHVLEERLIKMICPSVMPMMSA